MLRDTAWGLAGVACVLVTLYSMDLGVKAWRKFDEGDGPAYTTTYNGWDRRLRSNVTVGSQLLNAGPRLPTNASYVYNVINKSEVVTGPRAAGYEDVTKPDATASSPYLFQPVRYMNKEKRSVYREYTDG